MYIIKIQGTSKIPDFIQIRNDDFTLLAYFRINNPRKALSRCHLTCEEDEILRLARNLPYGKIVMLNLLPRNSYFCKTKPSNHAR